MIADTFMNQALTRFLRHFTHWQGRSEGDYWAVYEHTPDGSTRRIGLFMNEQEAIYYITEGVVK